jgi:hypothetical protein
MRSTVPLIEARKDSVPRKAPLMAFSNLSRYRDKGHDDFATFSQSILLQSLPEAADIGWGRRPDAQETDPAGLHLLRRRSLRLCNHRASEQNDELPPAASITLLEEKQAKYRGSMPIA